MNWPSRNRNWLLPKSRTAWLVWWTKLLQNLIKMNFADMRSFSAQLIMSLHTPDLNFKLEMVFVWATVFFIYTRYKCRQECGNTQILCFSTGRLSEKSYLPALNHTCTVFLKHLIQQCHGGYIWQWLPLDRWQEFALLIQLASIITSLIKFSKVNSANSVFFQLYHCQNKLIFNKMEVGSALY
jgi:hypothetical protein